MKLNKKLKEEVLKVYNIWLYSYLNGDVETYNHYLHKDYRFIGSTDNEVFLNKKDTTKFFEETADQLAGKAEARNSIKTIEQFGDIIFITDLFDAYFLNGDDWDYYGKFRFSSSLKKFNDDWQFVYQHFSTPDAKAQEGETLGTEQISIENHQLREAIQRRTIELEQKNKELEIETALEKVRSVASRMQKPDDLLTICETLYTELIKLGFQDLRNALINILYDEDGYFLNYDYSDHLGGTITKLMYNSHVVVENYLQQIRKTKDAFAEMQLKDKELEDWKNQRKVFGEPYDKRLDEADSLYYYFYSIGTGGIGISTLSPIDERNLGILKRFRNVFDFAYRRYVDITLAQEQAREAQIEAALERIRSRSMAMQKSEELADLSLELVRQVKNLGVETWFCAFNIYDNNKQSSTEWGSNGMGTFPKYKTPREGIFQEYYEIGKSGETLHIKEFNKNECSAHYDYLCSLPGVGKQLIEMKDAGHNFPKQQIDHIAYFKYGYILFITFEEATSSHDIFKRFAKVFEQTYTRFLDLQKAEEQAKESKIEMILEKVRSRTMAMQHSDELSEAANVLFLQIQNLGISTWSAGYNIWNDDKSSAVCYMSSEGTIQPGFNLPSVGVGYNHIKPLLDGNNFDVNEVGGKDLIEHYEFMYTIPGVDEILDNLKNEGISLPSFQILHIAYFSYGYLMFITYEPCPEYHDLFQRLAKVFDQTYTRFLDLQKAEKQAKESQVELSLARIRAKVTAMSESSDLLDIVVTMRSEFVSLGHEAHYFWYMRWNEDTYEKAMTSGDGSKIGMIMTLPRHIHGNIKSVADWEKSKEPTVVLDMDVEMSMDYVQKMITLGEFKLVDPNAPTADDMRHIGGLTFVMARTTYGEIGFSLPGVVSNPPKEGLDTLIRFAGVFDLAYSRFEDLKNAEAQAREAQIEVALERTRTNSMLMKHSDELDVTSRIFHEQLLLLGIDTEFSYVWLPDVEKQKHMFWASWAVNKGNSIDFQSKSVTYDLDMTDPYNIACFKAWEKPDIVHENRVDASEVTKFFTSFEELISGAENLKADLFPDGLYYSEAYMKYGCFGINIRRQLTTDEQNILKRFAKEFERTYTRFLDLKKAEAQTREAQINLAVERVRAKALAMHKSDEIMDVVGKLTDELMTLDIPDVIAATIFLKESDNNVRMWDLSSIEKLNEGYQLPLDITFTLKKVDPHLYLKRVWENEEDYFVEIQDEKGFDRLLEFFRENGKGEGADEIEEYIEKTNLKILHHASKKLNNGKLVIDLLDPPSDEIESILTKMGAAFDLAYKRFEDLQKAEEQAREAQIEVALEKVRSRTMAMQKGEELQDVVVLLYKELILLGFTNFTTCGYVEINEKTSRQSTWVTSPGGDSLGLFYLPLKGDEVFDKRYDAWKRQQTIFHQTVAGKQRLTHLEYAITTFGSKEAEEMVLNQFPDPTVFYCFNFSHGYLHLVTTSKLKEEEESLLARFTRVFEQTYARFLDLQKAETQAREAQIETALERVRARAMAMQQPEELTEVADVLREEMGLLGVEELETSSIYIYDNSSSKAECWYALKDASDKKELVSDHFVIDLDKTWVGKEMISFYKSDDMHTSIVMNGKNRIEWIRYCEQNSAPFRGYYGEIIPDRTYHLYKFSHGAIGMATADAISNENWGLLKRVAGVFSLAYARFKDLTQARIDLKQLKAEKKRAEDALAELKSTQSQLIQSEKMASLGELTAGIAHEIQNPLNFVNNFSEVSNELIDEMNEELDGGDIDEAKFISKDIKDNLEKINHHGKRAEAIVKGMLQHSRSSSGTKEPTNINVIADEYLRLAFHGLRAKDKSFNATLKTEFDESIGLIDVIPQEIGRVILNLITNAFYVVDEKKKSGVENFEPTVTVKTKKSTSKVEIIVIDNGNGIPKQIRDKIFQPFFTTKPTGQGTGLGLSMSYDIITKGHGGELIVNTKDGVGTEFVIQLNS